MADYKARLGSISAAQGVEVDEGLRQYMLRVYNYMGAGLTITGLVAFATVSSQGVLDAIYGSGLQIVILIAVFGSMFFFGARINKMSAKTAQTLFWVISAGFGILLAPILLQYTGASVAKVFFITAATFGTMSLWGYTTKRDLTGFGSFLMMGLIGLVIAIIVNIFMQSALLDFGISAIGVLVFTGLSAYDTQRIKKSYDDVSHDEELMTKSAIFGAFQLYIDFVYIFIFLMQFLGDRR